LVFAAVGIAVTRSILARGDGAGFLLLWGAIWFLGSGAAIFSGVTGLVRPQIFAHLTDEGVSFSAQHVRLIRWADLRGVRLGLRTVTRRNRTTFTWRAPLILLVGDPGLLEAEWKGFKFRHPGHPLGDGTAELLLKTTSCPISNEELIRKLSARAGIAPDLRPADPDTATLGGVKLNQPSKKGAGPRVIAGVLLAFGLTFACIGTHKLLKARASLDWPAAPAEIVSAEIETSAHHTKNGSSTSYAPRITYRYTVDGRTYDGSRAAFAYEASQAAAAEFVRRFPPGSHVDAYYDPRDPSEAVLVRGGQGIIWGFIGAGLAFATLGAWLLGRSLRTRPQGQ
jgi:hypothetical protein